MRVALLAIAALVAVALFFALRPRTTSPFTVNAPWNFYALNDSRRAAAFFLAQPRLKQTSAINASAFVRINNHTRDPLWLDGLTGVVHRSDQSWTILVLIDPQRLGADVYYSSAKFGVGWLLPKSEILTLAGHNPIPPLGQLSGFVFFGYPRKRYDARVDGVSILVRARSGETELGQNGAIWVRPYPFPDRRAPATNLRHYRFRYYCSIANLC
ncbi:MAG: hypothetical protein JO302_03120 [Candidatus Eremiobacteraeota bacterium]|nr:hypothetical protein [Candidatus Eremiobacteraeota bacterium]